MKEIKKTRHMIHIHITIIIFLLISVYISAGVCIYISIISPPRRYHKAVILKYATHINTHARAHTETRSACIHTHAHKLALGRAHIHNETNLTQVKPAYGRLRGPYRQAVRGRGGPTSQPLGRSQAVRPGRRPSKARHCHLRPG